MATSPPAMPTAALTLIPRARPNPHSLPSRRLRLRRRGVCVAPRRPRCRGEPAVEAEAEAEVQEEPPPPPPPPPGGRGKEGVAGWFRLDKVGVEIVGIALPAVLALAADPITSLVDTAFVGHLGSAELAAVGVSVSVFNLVSKLFNVPLLNVTTSFVAEQQAMDAKSSGAGAIFA